MLTGCILYVILLLFDRVVIKLKYLGFLWRSPCRVLGNFHGFYQASLFRRIWPILGVPQATSFRTQVLDLKQYMHSGLRVRVESKG